MDANQRRSVLAVSGGDSAVIAPVADGAIGVEDRRQVSAVYRIWVVAAPRAYPKAPIAGRFGRTVARALGGSGMWSRRAR